jgi:hypothetical protein
VSGGYNDVNVIAEREQYLWAAQGVLIGQAGVGFVSAMGNL